MFSPLTAVTGLTKDEIDAGCPLAEAVEKVRALIGPNVVLVGQRPKGDIEWLGLKEGIDYAEAIDIGASFRTWNARYKDWNWFSLRHEAYGLLGVNMSEHHSPVEDAQVSMRLFNRFVRDDVHGTKASTAGQKLTLLRYKKAFPASAARIGNIDGVCGNKFNPRACICGQPCGD
jgi:hypothetical protein